MQPTNGNVFRDPSSHQGSRDGASDAGAGPGSAPMTGAVAHANSGPLLPLSSGGGAPPRALIRHSSSSSSAGGSKHSASIAGVARSIGGAATSGVTAGLRGVGKAAWGVGGAATTGVAAGIKGFMSAGRGFREFLLKGQIVDLAVAVVVGMAFTDLVNACVRSLITPLIAAIFRGVQFNELYFTINDSRFLYGEAINALEVFLLVLVFMYYAIMRPLQRFTNLFYPNRAETKDCDYCLSEVPLAATRCKFCCKDLVLNGQQLALMRKLEAERLWGLAKGGCGGHIRSALACACCRKPKVAEPGEAPVAAPAVFAMAAAAAVGSGDVEEGRGSATAAAAGAARPSAEFGAEDVEAELRFYSFAGEGAGGGGGGSGGGGGFGLGASEGGGRAGSAAETTASLGPPSPKAPPAGAAGGEGAA